MPEAATRTRRDAMRWTLAAGLAGVVGPGAWATTAPAGAWPGAQLRGQAEYRYWGLAIYHAQLWVGEGFVPSRWADFPLGLALTYRRRLAGAAIAQRSVEEMLAQAALAPAEANRWEAAMRRVFPDVDAGDVLIGRHRPGEGAWFSDGRGRALGEVAEAAFSQRFFGIWLHERTRAPQLREALLGLAVNEAKR